MGHVRNLGAVFDRAMAMEKQVNKKSKNAYFNMRNISKLRRSLGTDTTKTAVNSLVTPHSDNGNELSCGKSNLFKELQVALTAYSRLWRSENSRHIL